MRGPPPPPPGWERPLDSSNVPDYLRGLPIIAVSPALADAHGVPPGSSLYVMEDHVLLHEWEILRGRFGLPEFWYPPPGGPYPSPDRRIGLGLPYHLLINGEDLIVNPPQDGAGAAMTFQLPPHAPRSDTLRYPFEYYFHMRFCDIRAHSSALDAAQFLVELLPEVPANVTETLEWGLQPAIF